MKKIPMIETDRLILRIFQLSDAQRVQNLAGAFEIADTTLNIPHPYPDGKAEEWIKSHKVDFAQNRAVHLAITLRKTKELIGAISLMNIEKEHGRAEMGYWIAKEHWNLGYATEAAKAMVQLGFKTLKLQRIFAQYFKRNPASGRILEKVGMQKEAVLRSHVQKWGRYEDVVICGMVRKVNRG